MPLKRDIYASCGCIDYFTFHAGRLDAEVEVPIPDDVARCSILEFLVRHYCSGGGGGEEKLLSGLTSEDFMDLARLAKGIMGTFES